VISLFAVLGDDNFPSTSVAKAARAQVIHADGHDIPTLLAAILQLMPLDTYDSYPVSSYAFFKLNA
jgi:L-fucose mutarotase